MAALRDASAEEAAAIYLAYMSEHHLGAIEMAQAEIVAGVNPAAIALADEMITVLTAELTTMDDLLAG